MIAVSDGDLVLVPKGHHPCGVPYGFEMYYLNVMAHHCVNGDLKPNLTFNGLLIEIQNKNLLAALIYKRDLIA